tara:strand:- start:51 stop:425 length:375 start_codon:yes stop_codon:yes gene_type:complete
MKITTALNHKSRAITAIKSLYHTAQLCGMPSADITKKRNEIMLSIAHCPQWVKSSVSGYHECLYDMNFNNLEFCYELKGILYTTSKIDTGKPSTERLYKKGLGSLLSKANNGAFYWRNTDKRYF